jgi:hypothetical protein
MSSVREWLKSGGYLPGFLRDFHAQKDVFKWIDRQDIRKDDGRDVPNWIAAHIYTIDIFLWFMALHGYTLQRSRVRVPFEDLHAKIAALKAEDAAAFCALLYKSRAAAQTGEVP